MTLTQKRMFILAGAGLVISGAATAFVVYQGLQSPASSGEQSTANRQDSNFKLEEIHANPGLVMHIHAQLELWRAGQRIEVPNEIGMSQELWRDHSLDQFGPSIGLLAPIHTHDTSGTIHIESTALRNFTFGEFLSIWGMDSTLILKVTDGDGTSLENYGDYVMGRNAKFVMEIKD